MSLVRNCFLAIAVLFFLSPGHTSVQPKSPEQFFGHRVGAEKKLIQWDRLIAYLQELSETTDRLKFHHLGDSTMGNPLVMAVISSPGNLRDLDHYREINRRLFDPRTISDEVQARKLINEGKVFVLVTCSIHSNEIGASQMSVELAHKLVTEKTPQIDAILDSVVFLLVPSLNPDGHIMITDWYNRTVNTPHEDAPLPWLFHPYTGHDNNRDSFMFTQKETQLIGKVLYQDWFPAVWLDLHQMGSAGPRIFVMPAMDPINPNVDPLIYRNAGLLGFSQAAALEREGKNGIIYGDVYTYWWEGAMAWAGLWHNMIGLLTEVASARLAGTIEQELADPQSPRVNTTLPQNGRLLPPPADLNPRLQYPQPWRGGKWSLRDIVDYELIATMGLLESSAGLRSQLLESLYIVGKRQIELGTKGDPYAVIVPAVQPDRPTAVKMLQTLEYAGIEVHQAQEPFTADDVVYPAGTYVLLMSQPFRAYVKDMLEPQTYPAAALANSSYSPYDITGWSLGMQMGVETVFVRNPFEARLKRLNRIKLPSGSLSGHGHDYVISHEPNNSIRAVNRLLKLGYDVTWVSHPLSLGRRQYGPGAIVVRGGNDLRPVMTRITEELGIDAVAEDLPELEGLRIQSPRTALYQPWGGNMDEGWTRWLLEQNEFPFVTAHPEDIRAGALDNKFDVIIFPDMSSSEIIYGLTQKNMPEEFRGGIEEPGVRALQHFINQGGTLITLGRSSLLAVEKFGAPYRDALRGLNRETFLCPGSILRISVDNTHPIGYGMPEEASGYFINSIALEPTAPESAAGDSVLVRYPSADILRSGWLHGESYLHGKIGAVEVKLGKGRMILMPLRVQHRAQSHGTFKLLFNSILTSAAKPTAALLTTAAKGPEKP